MHLSNVDEREEWRRKSVVADLVAARFVGHGPDGYKMALDHLKEKTRMSSRIERLRELLEEPLLVTNLVNVLYLTGFDSSNAALLVEPDRARLFTDFRYIESARAIEGVEAVQTKRAVIGWLCENLSGRIGFESDVLAVVVRRAAAGGRDRARAAEGARRATARGQGRGRARDVPARRARSPTGCSSGS